MILDRYYRKKAESFIRKGRPDKALITLKKIAKFDYRTEFLRGVSYFEIMDLDAANKSLRCSIDQKSTAQAVRILAEILIIRKQWKDALDILKPYRDNQNTFDLVRIIESGNEERNNYRKYLKLAIGAMYLLRKKSYLKSIELLAKAINYTEKKNKIKKQIGAIYLNNLKGNEEAINFLKNQGLVTSP